MEPSHETLVELLDLQRIDSTIDRLEYRLRHLPEQAELDSLNGRLGGLERALGEQQVLADESASRQRKLDGEIDSISRKIEAEEAKLLAGNVASPRELSALQSEIEYLKRRKSAVEDEDLEVMEQKESVDARISALRKEQLQLQEEVAALNVRVQAARAEIDSELESARSERQAWAAKFEAGLLSLYEDLRASKAGVAIAALVDGTCQGCHMKLPAQEVVQMRRTKGAVRCVECGRLLVVG